jgi:TolB-like protein
VVQISALRRALGEDRDFIRTVTGRGYRFIAEIRSLIADPGRETGLEHSVAPDASTSPPSDLPTPVSRLIGRETQLEEGADLRAGPIVLADARTSPNRPLRSVLWWLLGFALAMVLAASLSWVLYSRNQASSKIRSVAVLPLESLSGDASQDYFADGMTDELIADLGQISALRVISRTSMMTYKHVHKLLPEIARELDVEAVVEGTVLRSGERVRITAQLIRMPVERHIWAQSFEGDLRDTLVLQKSVARSIAEQIQASLRVHDHLRHRGGMVFEDLGEQLVKNIAHPIRAFRLRIGEDTSTQAAPVPEETAEAIELPSAPVTISELSADNEVRGSPCSSSASPRSFLRRGSGRSKAGG